MVLCLKSQGMTAAAPQIGAVRELEIDMKRASRAGSCHCRHLFASNGCNASTAIPERKAA